MNASRQRRVLYREFLFRIADRELLSAYSSGDASRLLLQILTLLLGLGALFSIPALFIARVSQPQAQLLISWSVEHFLIATTMLTVGVFAVLGWGALFSRSARRAGAVAAAGAHAHDPDREDGRRGHGTRRQRAGAARRQRPRVAAQAERVGGAYTIPALTSDPRSRPWTRPDFSPSSTATSRRRRGRARWRRAAGRRRGDRCLDARHAPRARVRRGRARFGVPDSVGHQGVHRSRARPFDRAGSGQAAPSRFGR